ncbi:MAG: dihydroorotate dehydrogenase-like protein [Thermoanaerobaculaceae bacterium]|nr:dihydroorotate dehydrogenase-like protein [Thermoanaerobaculaceae bacterium]
MDLSTTYLGFKLSNPLMPGASPLVDDLDNVKRLEDAGAAAIVMHSLFEEQITHEQLGHLHAVEMHEDSFAEALSYFPRAEEYRLGPEAYLEQIRKIKAMVKVPVIASLNGTSPAGWLDYAKLIEQAGADALELNVYYLATQAWETSESVERRTLEAVRVVKGAVKIPVAVKLSPFYSALANLAKQLDEAGADALVLFNRFYQPDIDVEELEVVPSLQLSDSSELLLRLRWLAILSGHVKGSLACSGGVHSPLDAIKAVMAGAHAVQLVSALLKREPAYLQTVRSGMERWMEEHEYSSLSQMHASMSHQKSPNPQALERANYMRILQGWRP